MKSGKKTNSTINGHSVMYTTNTLDAQHAKGGHLISLPEDNFMKGGKGLHDSVYASSIVNYKLGGKMEQLTHFNEGGSHEENPLGGIPQGMNPQGGMNLVEEKETKLNAADYIFSNALKLDQETVKGFNLPNRFVGKSFAEVSKIMEKPKSRRENDTIETNAIKKDLSSLMAAQEDFKQKEVQRKLQEIQSINPNFLGSLMKQNQPIEQHPAEMGMPEQSVEQMPQGMPQEGMEQQNPEGFMYGGPMRKFGGGGFKSFKDQTHAEQLDTSANIASNIGGIAQVASGAMRGNNATDNEQTNAANAGYEAIKAGVSKAGPYGAVIGGIMNLGDAIGAPIKNKMEKTDSQGNLLNTKGTEAGYTVGTILNPLKGLMHGIKTKEWTPRQYRKGAAVRAKENTLGPNWAHPMTDSEGIVQDPSYNPVTGMIDQQQQNMASKYGGFIFADGGSLTNTNNNVFPPGQKTPTIVKTLSTIDPKQIEKWRKIDSTPDKDNTAVDLTGAVLVTDKQDLDAYYKAFPGSRQEAAKDPNIRIWKTKEGAYVSSPSNSSPQTQAQTQIPPQVPPAPNTGGGIARFYLNPHTGEKLDPAIYGSPTPDMQGVWQDNNMLLDQGMDMINLKYANSPEGKQRLAEIEAAKAENRPKPNPEDLKGFRAFSTKNPGIKFDEYQKIKNYTPEQMLKYNINKKRREDITHAAGGFLDNSNVFLTGGWKEKKRSLSTDKYNSEDDYTESPEESWGNHATQSNNIVPPTQNRNLYADKYGQHNDDESLSYITALEDEHREFSGYSAEEDAKNNPRSLFLNEQELREEDAKKTSAEEVNSSDLDRKPGETEEEYKSRLQKLLTSQTDNNKDLRVKETGASFAGKYAPVAYNLAKGLFDKQTKRKATDYFENVAIPKLNIDSQLRATEQAYAGANNAIKDIASTGGSYLANRIASAGQEAHARADLHTQKENYDNTMAAEMGKYNTSGRVNAKLAADDFNLRSKAAKDAFTQQGLSQLSQIATSNEQNKLGMSYAELMAPDFKGRAGYVSVTDMMREELEKRRALKNKVAPTKEKAAK